MLETNAVIDHLPRVAEFYDGKSIFITGASGFVGSLLLELLLRCCLGIKFIYILLRTKKNVQPEARKEEIFNKKIFDKLKKRIPELFEKVRVISGDIIQPNFGMSEDDTHHLLEEVSIVFHCAAVINFNKPLMYILKTNVLSLDYVIELCRKMRKFEVLVYTSTAYSNSNHREFPLKEEVYRLPSHAGKFLDAVKNEDQEKLQELVNLCKPDWPNSYCFSKCLAENVIADTASDLAVAIVRPSIVYATWKRPIPGYAEENSGGAVLTLGVGKGFIKVTNADAKCKMDFVPADFVANTHVLSAWSVGTKRTASPFVVNCTASERLRVEVSTYFGNIIGLAKTFPFPRSFAKTTGVKVVRNKYLYCFLTAYYHYLPAIVLDGILRISGNEPRLYSLYRTLDKVMSSLFLFITHTFEFERNNLQYLDNLISPEDKQDVTLDLKETTMHGLIFSLSEGSLFYDWKIDKKSQSERERIMHRRLMQIRCIKGTFLMACCLLIYWVLYTALF